ncbi:YggS family pyridoxal phosphate-dependent enzyme [Blattabacterium cuenoti]|uniref:YggS family pyridoxal phosphate-dependent enzyme n=1 Tax=Blattabacterium cuenoti TaxID=1653831 RepID=UPI00163B7BC3|nr:YggS family pyridoxal phosphate-dependent enzyme [Blattabacterium cuenoti]
MIKKNFFSIKKSIPKNVGILAVSKNQDILSIRKLYQVGQRDFGENFIQEMVKKYHLLPKDIRWHMIGKIQSNKLKYIIPFVHLIHSIQKFKHIEIINKIGNKHNKIIQCLLQIRISNEINKSGISEEDGYKIFESSKNMKNIKIIGLMGLASFKEKSIVNNEFFYLKKIYDKYKNKYQCNVLSMGMSRDFNLAIQHGSTIIRLGNYLFGNRK